MTEHNEEQMYEIILNVLEPRLEGAGFSRSTVKPETDLLESGILDSFGMLDILMQIEEEAGVSTDLAEMDFEKAVTAKGLAEEIIRINETA